MKKVYTIILAMICFNQILAQSIQINLGNVKSINSEHHGLSFVNFYNTCKDNACTDNIKNLKPRVIRFPSAGDADMYSMNIDSLGYGINFANVAAYLADRYNSLQNPLTYTPLVTSYTCPPAFDASASPVPLNYNASVPAVFASTTAASSYTNDLQSWYCNYRREKTQITQSYLSKFIQYVKEMEDSLQSGERINVIYVANIFSGTPSDLVKTLNQLTKVSLNGIKSINVVGVELSNESWGKANNDIFPDPNSGNEFYNYVRGSNAYTGCLSLKGDFISAIRSNFPNIKIGFPTAPLTATNSTDYYGCNITSSSATRFNTWNSQTSAYVNSQITVTVGSTPTTVAVADAFVIHKYFDDKYWGNAQEGTGSCNNCLANNTGTKQYKNYLRGTTNFNHQYTYYPQVEDTILKSSFDCQLNETFKFIDSGFVKKVLDGYRLQLGINNFNQKKIWMTEWNILESNNDDTTYLFHNTFNHAVLTLGWKMALYKSNWSFAGANDFFQYSTFFNGVSQQQNGGLSKRINTNNFGDGTSIDTGSVYVKRMAYWANKITRHISLDSLKWVDNTATNLSAYPNTRFYSFVNPNNTNLYVYYINADDSNFNLNLDSLKLTGYVLDTNITKEYFGVRNNYSTAGYSEQFEKNKFYKIGNNWQASLQNEPNNTYSNVASSSKNNTLQRKSIGCLKIPIKSNVGLNKNNFTQINTKVFPNPSKGIITIERADTSVEGEIIITNMLGNVVKIIKPESQLTKMDLSDLIDGVYFITINSKNSIVTHKVILIK